jgi:hypothetical protein
MRARGLVTVVSLLVVRGSLEAQPKPPTSVPKTYGTNFQALHIGASAFQPDYPMDYSFESFGDGYIRYSGDSLGRFSAPVTFPPGAEIHAVCAYLYDIDPEYGVQLFLTSGRLIPGGLDPGIDFIVGVTSSGDSGYGVYCTDVSPPYTYSEAAGDDGVFLQHYVTTIVTPGNAVGGVKIIWRQQVSPPPAAPTFGDVPISHPFFQFIEALAASGITGGCAPGKFCPNAPLTRGQMAVFLAKALGLHWPY